MCNHPWAQLIQVRDELVCMACGDMLNGREVARSQMAELARLGDKLSQALDDLLKGNGDIDLHYRPYKDALEAYKFFRYTVMGDEIQSTLEGVK